MVILLIVLFTRIALVPTCHWKIIINSFGHKNLVKINNSVVKSSCTCGQVEIPHTQERFIKHRLFPFNVIEEILFPVKQGFVIVKAKIFNIQSMEIIFCHVSQNFSETWNSSAWENVFLDPWIARMFLEGTDKVKKE